MKQLMFKQLIAGAAVSVLTLTGCGGSSSGSASEGSASPKGTGYLKIALPEIPEAGVASAGAGTLAQVITSGTYAEAPSVLSFALEDLNTDEACVGGSSNIPFVICIVESLGINAAGTYNGQTPKGEAAQAVVTNLTGDPDGYTLQAEVTLTGSSEKVFSYKADADGKAGVIEIKPDSIFATNSPGKTGIRVSWNSTAVASQAIEYSHHYSGTSSNIVSEQVTYIVAVINGMTGVADMASRHYMYVDSLSGFQEANSRFAQSRVGLDRTIVLHASCTNGSSPVEGGACFNPSASGLDELVAGKQLTCGTVNTSGLIELNVTDSVALTNATAGSMAAATNFSADATCATLKNTVGAGDAFIVRLDKNDAPGLEQKGIHHIVRAATYNNMKLLSSGNFLQ